MHFSIINFNFKRSNKELYKYLTSQIIWITTNNKILSKLLRRIIRVNTRKRRLVTVWISSMMTPKVIRRALVTIWTVDNNTSKMASTMTLISLRMRRTTMPHYTKNLLLPNLPENVQRMIYVFLLIEFNCLKQKNLAPSRR